MPNSQTRTIQVFAFFILVILSSYAFMPAPDSHANGISSNPDSLILEAYMSSIKKEFVGEEESLTTRELDSMFYEANQHIVDQQVNYSPDSTFKIFTIEVEGCGAYCNSTWYSWIHFDLLGNEQSTKIDLNLVEAIYPLSDRKYLIVDRSWGRAASVLTFSCMGTKLISYSADGLIIHPIAYRSQDHFGFCQEEGIEMLNAPFIQFDPNTEWLDYRYGNNYLYSHGMDVDTVRQGQFRYVNGQFILERETVTVNDKRVPGKEE
ncbi:hypothetical protein [Pontibacter sp. G13]|uniref:hypothetical protein n=1 Tax=Pontibacter sp. G13 TaxID=3074898 RepID=UPI002889321B|nr:hypothetical protein [Pontibacter sp. G13]WNJ17888.1 hypothetical protein RJD25_23795 [Pontibacter sp. G13]